MTKPRLQRVLEDVKFENGRCIRNLTHRRFVDLDRRSAVLEFDRHTGKFDFSVAPKTIPFSFFGNGCFRFFHKRKKVLFSVQLKTRTFPESQMNVFIHSTSVHWHLIVVTRPSTVRHRKLITRAPQPEPQCRLHTFCTTTLLNVHVLRLKSLRLNMSLIPID